MKLHKKLFTSLFLVSIFTLCASKTPVHAQDGPFPSITIPVTTEETASPGSISFPEPELQIEAGKEYILSPELTPSREEVSFTCESDHPEIAFLTTSLENGHNLVLQGFKEGVAIIKVTTEDGAEAVLTVTVTVPQPVEEEIPVRRISALTLEEGTFTLAERQKRRLVLSISPKNSTTEDFDYISSDPNVAKFSKDGVVTAVSRGSARLQVIAKDTKQATLSLKVTVTKRSSSFTPKFSELSIVNTTRQKYNYADISRDLKELSNQYGDRFSYHSLGTSRDGRRLYEAILGNPNAKKKVMITAGIHGREYMTTQLTMKQIEFYCHHYYDGIYKNTYFSELFENTAFYIMPMCNPDGTAISQYGISKIRDKKLKKIITRLYRKNGSSSYYLTRWKANAAGVNLNYNFDCHWDTSGQGRYLSSESNHGKKPLSEPESRAMAERFLELKPVAEIGYHATGSIIYHDYGQKGALARTNAKFYNTIRSLTGYRSAPGFNIYAAAGFGDWITHEMKVPSLCIEIGVNSTPLPAYEFSSIFSKNLYVYAATAKLFR